VKFGFIAKYRVALVMATWRRSKPDALLHHSDQGSQYTSERLQQPMAEPMASAAA
jgi:transposase InsO family protein